jgi:thiamine-phosphate pyrophosphorylase
MTNIIVISPEYDVPNETTIVNQLFDNGLELFHLRKPMYSEKDIIKYCELLNPEHLSKISLHQHHQIALNYNIKFLHFNKSYIDNGKLNDFINSYADKIDEISFSTSFHSWEQLMSENKNIFDYCFLSPVFDSISKKDYKQQLNNDFIIPKIIDIKVFALGGIDISKVENVFNRKFYGIALLGYLWEDINNIINKFHVIKNLCNKFAL